MRTSMPRPRTHDLTAIAPVPLLEASDLPGDDAWSLPDGFANPDGGDDDCFAMLAVSRSFDD